MSSFLYTECQITLTQVATLNKASLGVKNHNNVQGVSFISPGKSKSLTLFSLSQDQRRRKTMTQPTRLTHTYLVEGI